jgi:hypothetical protein
MSLTPSSGERVGSKLGSDRTFIPVAVTAHLQLASPVLCTTLIVLSDSLRMVVEDFQLTCTKTLICRACYGMGKMLIEVLV